MSCNFETKIYIANVSPFEDKNIYNSAYEMLDVRRQEKTDRLKNEADKIRSVAAGILLNECYRMNSKSGVCGMPSEMPPIQAKQGGKPYFVTGPICFNLSHSGDYVMCALSGNEVGCDVEYKRDAGLKIAKRFFSQAEQEYLAGCDDADAFAKLWTLKESVLKASGVGISYPMDEFSVVGNGVIVDSINMLVKDEDIRLYIKNYRNIGDYAFSACSYTDDLPADCIELNLLSVFE